MKPDIEIPHRVQRLDDRGDLPLIALLAPGGRALVCLQGAHVIDYQPSGQPPLLWLSDQTPFKVGLPIRGGIPLCWPWFGDHPQDATLPAHGLARARRWQLVDSAADASSTRLRLRLEQDSTTRQLWPYAFRLELLIQLDQQLSLTLTCHNPNDRPMPISEALHSYFRVADIAPVEVGGLLGCRYRDKLEQMAVKVQQTPLTLDGETDRVYLDTRATITLDDPGLRRQIRIAKSGSDSTVVWNPWRERSARMPDMSTDGYRTMLCVESANAADNALEIGAGQSHSLSIQLSSHAYAPDPAMDTGATGQP